MAILDRSKPYGTICGAFHEGAMYEQGGKMFYGNGAEFIMENGVALPPEPVPEPEPIAPEPVVDAPRPINNTETKTVIGVPPEEPIEQEQNPLRCDTCGFVAKSKFGLNAHIRGRHS